MQEHPPFVIAYNNLLVNLFGEAVSFQAHNDQPRRIWFFHNTVLGLGPALRLSGADARFEQIIDGNAIFSERPDEFAFPSENRVSPLPRAEEVLTNPFAAAPDALDISPVNSSLDRTAAGIRLPPDLPSTDRRRCRFAQRSGDQRGIEQFDLLEGPIGSRGR